VNPTLRALLHSKTFLALIAIPGGALLLGLFFWNLRNTDPMWAIVSFVLVYDPDMRAAISTGLWRLGHTVVGSGIVLALIFAFGLHKWVMPASLAIGVLVCGVALRFHPSWKTLLVTIALVAGSALLQPGTGTDVATLRAIEVTVGSALAIVFSWAAARLRASSP
jgi:uncharacterized membrane protein YccC